MPKVSNANVYGLPESIIRSGYPMLTEIPTGEEFVMECAGLVTLGVLDSEDLSEEALADQHIKRAINLANSKGGGHDQFLTGILVDFDLTFSNKAWVELERYTFMNFVSSESTMHRAARLPIDECCNEYVNKNVVESLKAMQAQYNSIPNDDPTKKEEYLRLLYNMPSGFELTAGLTTNYRCLKNVYAQRRHHRLPDWHVFCDWVETLPMAKYLITGEYMNDKS